MTIQSVWQGENIRLRAVEPDDWQVFFDWFQDTEFDRLTDTTLFPFSTAVVKKWVTDLAEKEPWKDHDFRWVIENLDGEFIGTANTHSCDPRNGTFEYGVAIRREYWRKGYASEAINLILTHFCKELRYQKVNVQIYSFNDESLRLHEKLGFQQEGRLRRMIYTLGTYYDAVIMGMTREEFGKGNGT